MSTLDNLLSLLNKWPKWREITEAPERIKALKERISDLEKRLERCPGEACPSCGHLSYRVKESRFTEGNDMGGYRRRIYFRTWECEKCGFSEELVNPPGQS